MIVQIHDSLGAASTVSNNDAYIYTNALVDASYAVQTAAAGSSGVWSEANTLAYLNGVEARVKAGLIDVVTWAEWLESSQGRAT